MDGYLIISTSNDLVRIAARHIVCIVADGNYSTIFQTGNELRMVTLQLGQLERLIADQLPQIGQTFIRVGKSLIINSNAVYYINVPKQQLILVDIQQNRHTFSAGKEALKTLKDWFDHNQDNERN